MADRSGYIGRAPSDSSVTVARQTNQPTGVTTTFVFNSGYDVGYLDVYINGSKLINVIDYQATDAQNVTLTTAAESGDVIEFVAYKAFNLSNVITSADGDFTVDGSITASNGTFSDTVTANTVTQNGVGIVTIGADGSTLTGIVTTLTAGDNISLSGSTGNVTITGLANTSNVLSDTINSGSLNVTGITTVTTLNATTGSFTGNVSVGGTLTYEDVTNVDSVGVVTARTGVRVNAGGIVVTAGISTLGAGVSVTGPYKENITAMGALEVDCSTGNYFTKTISGNSTFTFANVPTGCAYAFTLELTHSSGTVTWPSSVKFPADTAPTLTTGKTHLFMFLTDDGGTRFRGSSLVDYVN